MSRRNVLLTKIFQGLIGLIFFCGSSLSTAQPFIEENKEDYSLTFEDLGVDKALRLIGVDGMSKVKFSIPATEEVSQLRLNLNYRTSPDLLEKVSHLKIYLNDHVVHVISLDNEIGDQNRKAELDLPLQFLKERNSLSIQLIGHYQWLCEDPLHSSLWATVSPSSQLDFQVKPRTMPNNLSLLPSPFFEEGDDRLLDVNLVISNTEPAYIEAAAIIASWLGVKASYRGAVFHVLNELPQKGNAIVLWDGKSSIDALSDMQDMKESEIRMIANPNNLQSKLLIIKGSNAENIKIAAKTIALGAETLSGDSVLGMKINEPPRQPYDAPAWITTSRPVSFKELAPYENFTAHGFFDNEVKLNLQLPPDLFGWKNKGIPVNLRYYYTLQASAEQAQLQVRLNYNELNRINLKNRKDTALTNQKSNTGTGDAEFRLPLDKLSSAATLHFNFLYHRMLVRDCQQSLIEAYRSGIDPSSTIDLRGLYHYMPMPNLAVFSTAGFPFSKMADLSETVAVLSESPSLQEYSTFFTLIGHISASVGYPATRIHVMQGADTNQLKNKDVLLFSIGKEHPLLGQWQSSIPQFKQAIVKDESWFKKILRGFLNEETTTVSSFPTFTPLMTLKGFESPLSSNRTVVALMSQNSEQSFQAVQRLVDDEVARSQVQGGITLIGESDVYSMEIPSSYHVGKLAPWVKIQWYLEHRPLIVVFMFLLGAFLIGAILFLVLRAQASRRLGNDPKTLDK